MDSVNVRQAIARAITNEQQTALLAMHLVPRINNLHKAIHLQGIDAVRTLTQFVVRYTEHVPDFLDALNGIGLNANCNEVTEPLTAICTEFFVQPPELLNGFHGLQAAMNEAYLAHRLIEEVNNHFMAQCGEVLVPMDMTRSNLIIHHLIGEPFANQLDAAVKLIVERLEAERLLATDGKFNPGLAREIYWGMEAGHWPCFTDTLSVGLLFGENDCSNILH